MSTDGTRTGRRERPGLIVDTLGWAFGAYLGSWPALRFAR